MILEIINYSLDQKLYEYNLKKIDNNLVKINLEENESLAMVYALYGNIYTDLNDHSQAIEYRERSSSQCNEMGMEMLACKYLVALAGSYERIGEHQKVCTGLYIRFI